MKRTWFCVVACALVGASTNAIRAEERSVRIIDRTYAIADLIVNHTRFQIPVKIPVKVDLDSAHGQQIKQLQGAPAQSDARCEQIKQVQLFASADEGETWEPVTTLNPDNTAFSFQAPRDGMYWFIMRIVMQDGAVEPQEVSSRHTALKVQVTPEETTKSSEGPTRSSGETEKSLQELKAAQKKPSGDIDKAVWEGLQHNHTFSFPASSCSIWVGEIMDRVLLAPVVLHLDAQGQVKALTRAKQGKLMMNQPKREILLVLRHGETLAKDGTLVTFDERLIPLELRGAKKVGRELDADARIHLLKRQLESMSEEAKQAKAELQRTRSELERIKTEIERLAKQLEELARKFQRGAPPQDTPKRGNAPPPPPPGVKGSIQAADPRTGLAANTVQHSIAALPATQEHTVLEVFDNGHMLLSFGRGQVPISEGAPFLIWRPKDHPQKAQFIGRGEIITLGVNYSVARIRGGHLTPAPGDSVHCLEIENDATLHKRPLGYGGAIIEGKLEKKP